MSDVSGEAGATMKTTLERCIDCALELKTALADERAALERRDTDAMAGAAEAKERLTAELAGLEESRRRIAGGGGDATMRALADGCGDADLAAHWDRYRDVARDCDALNRTNGAIIQLRRRQIVDGLTLLRGEPPAAGTYTQTGAARVGAGGRELTEA